MLPAVAWRTGWRKASASLPASISAAQLTSILPAYQRINWLKIPACTGEKLRKPAAAGWRLCNGVTWRLPAGVAYFGGGFSGWLASSALAGNIQLIPAWPSAGMLPAAMQWLAGVAYNTVWHLLFMAAKEMTRLLAGYSQPSVSYMQNRYFALFGCNDTIRMA